VFGTWEDICFALDHYGKTAFREALQSAPPGLFDNRSWLYWHHRLHLLPLSTTTAARYSRMRPRLDILRPEQQRLWPELVDRVFGGLPLGALANLSAVRTTTFTLRPFSILWRRR